MTTTLRIKNMVCARCIRSVTMLLEEIGYKVTSVELGTATIASEAPTGLDTIRLRLQQEGFDLVDDRKTQLVEAIKTLIIDLVHRNGLNTLTTPLSDYIARALAMDYHYLSGLFSQLETTTIERYVILQKIERAKELLIYDELTLTQIAHQLGYKNVSYLSAQFKEQTGFTPSAFKQLKGPRRVALDRVTS